jgi:hypothetical protein
MVAISALVFGIIEGPADGWTSGLVLTAFAVALVFGLASRIGGSPEAPPLSASPSSRCLE